MTEKNELEKTKSMNKLFDSLRLEIDKGDFIEERTNKKMKNSEV